MKTNIAPEAVISRVRRAASSQRIVSVTTGSFDAGRRLTRIGKSLAEVLRYQNQDVVARISKEEKMPTEEAASLFRDVLLFLWLGQFVKGSLVPTPRIDLGWHVFLLFTKDYREFCGKFFGRFVDHHPRRLTDKPDNGQAVEKSYGDVQTVLVKDLNLSLSRNWIYSRFESSGAAAKCCGNCGSDCCKR